MAMSVTKKGVSPEAAEEPVGQVDPGDPNYERLQAIYVEQRSIDQAETIENAWRAFKVNREVCGGDMVIICPPGRRRFPPRTNPHHLDQINYPNDICHGCKEGLQPPQSPQGVEQHFYEGQEHIHTHHLYHPACWNKVYQEAVEQGAKAVAALNLWKYEPADAPRAKPHVAAKVPPKAAATPTTPRRVEKQQRSPVVPEGDDPTVKRHRMPFSLTIPLLEQLVARQGIHKLRIVVDRGKVEASVDWICERKIVRDFCFKWKCSRRSMHSAYLELRRRDVLARAAAEAEHQPAPKPIVKPPVEPVETSETGPRPSWMHNAWNWLQGKDDGSPSIH